MRMTHAECEHKLHYVPRALGRYCDTPQILHRLPHLKTMGARGRRGRYPGWRFAAAENMEAAARSDGGAVDSRRMPEHGKGCE